MSNLTTSNRWCRYAIRENRQLRDGRRELWDCFLVGVLAIMLQVLMVQVHAEVPSTGESLKGSIETLSAEAIRESKKYLETHWRKCGSGYFSKTRNDYRELVGVHFQLAGSQKLTEIDRLNGYQWKGTVAFTYKRYRDFTHGWGDWDEGPAPTGTGCEPQWDIWKRNGEWTVNFLYCPIPQFSCEDVPAG